MFNESSHNLLAAEGIWLISCWNSLVNCGIIITIERLEINKMDINVITKEAHLGILKKTLILPIRVHNAIEKIIEAKKSIRISFKLHTINMEIIKAVIDKKLVDFNFNN